mgnify:CR=1 FL=1
MRAVGLNQAMRAEYAGASKRSGIGPEISISNIQPDPYGSLLMTSGFESKSVLTETIFPVSGE